MTIRACIESLRRWVNEIIVVDTGSTDRTPEICKELGAKVYYHTWPDSFAEARNYAIDYASGDWIFWMDSDDVLPEECGAKLRKLVDEQSDPSIMGYVVQVHCPHVGDDGEIDWTYVDHVKLFRNRPDLRWEFRIHENILPSIRRAGGEIAWTDLFVVHAGSDQTPEGKRRKLERDYRLLELELMDRPEHPFALFNLGMTHHDCGRYEEAASVLERARNAGASGDSHMRKLYALWASSLRYGGRSDEAERVCGEGRRLYPEDVELAFLEASLFEDVGRHREAADAYRRILGMRPHRYLASMDAAMQTTKARHNLAVVLEKAGNLGEASEEWKTLIGKAPGFRSGWLGSMQFLCDHGTASEAEFAHRQYLDRWPSDAAAWHNLGVTHLKLGNAAAAVADFGRSLAIRPDYPLTLSQLAVARGMA